MPIEYADDIAINTNCIEEANTILHQIEEISKYIGPYINVNKMEYMSSNQVPSVSLSLKSLNGYTIYHILNTFVSHLGYIDSYENNVRIRIDKEWAVLNNT